MTKEQEAERRAALRKLDVHPDLIEQIVTDQNANDELNAKNEKAAKKAEKNKPGEAEGK